MTRINCIPVQELTDQHLIAEYRELPMVGAALNRSRKSKNGVKYIKSNDYILNAGHVTFFYNKGKYLERRYSELITEMSKRGFNANLERSNNLHHFDYNEMNEWYPNYKDMQINRDRIDIRIAAKPEWYRFYGKPIC